MVFAPVSASVMAGIPASHASVASGFLMTLREIGAALGVAVLSAVASSAGFLVTQGRRRRRLRARVVAAAGMAPLFPAVAMPRMPAARVNSATTGMRMR